MIIRRMKEDADVAIVDPNKKVGEKGQFKVYKSGDERIPKLIAKAKNEFKRIEYIFKGFDVGGGVKLGLEIVERKLRPGTVMLFHWHEHFHEITIVKKGKVGCVVSIELGENFDEIMKSDHVILKKGSVIIIEPGERHAIFNPGIRTASLITIHVLQGKFSTAPYQFKEMPDDWHRRKVCG